jgi:hypothetical protein
VIRFRFELYPPDQVSPWGGERPRLHWFGLTEGWYWLEVRGQEFLHRTRHVGPHPYVDYYLARLWEDVIALTPRVLEPVPDDLQPFIASHPTQWAHDPLEFVDEPERNRPDGLDAADHPVVSAAMWHSEHYLDFGYMRNPPELRLWRTSQGDRDEMTLDWRHEDDGEVGYTTDPEARLSVPTTAYLAAVHTLDGELMDSMRQRVEDLECRGGLLGTDLDLAQLRLEHDDRRHWLARNLNRRTTTDWNAVRQGAGLLLGSLR